MHGFKTLVRGLFALLFSLLLAATAHAQSCAGPGLFATTLPCCAQARDSAGNLVPLVKDAQQRCQPASCKKVGQPATMYLGGEASDCCFGLAAVSGVCKVPTLQRTCNLIGMPAGSLGCCKGLARDSATGVCKRTANTCAITQIESCCSNRATNTCNCYCPAPYYVGS